MTGWAGSLDWGEYNRNMPTETELEVAATFVHYELQQLMYMRRANPAAVERQSTPSHYKNGSARESEQLRC